VLAAQRGRHHGLNHGQNSGALGRIRGSTMWFLRLYLFSGLVAHKLVWELLKRCTPATARPRAAQLTLVKVVKIAILVGILVQTLLPDDVFPIARNATALRLIGTLIYTCGLLTAIVGRFQLGRNWSDIETPTVGEEHTVVTHGLYRFIRHPIYVGDLLLLLGLELALNSWLVLGVFALIPVILRRAVEEEKFLEGQLPGYRLYVQRTKRFIPFVV